MRDFQISIKKKVKYIDQNNNVKGIFSQGKRSPREFFFETGPGLLIFFSS